MTTDRDHLDSIERYFETHREDCLLDTPEVEFLIALAHKGIQFEEAAATESDVQAASIVYDSASCPDNGCSYRCYCMASALQAAAAWRKAREPKPTIDDAAIVRACKRLIDMDPCISGHHETHIDLMRPKVEAIIDAVGLESEWAREPNPADNDALRVRAEDAAHE